MNLADIYSYIDSKKRAVGGLLSDPAGTLDKYVSQLREDHQAQTNLMSNAYPMAGDKTVLNSPHQLDQFRQQLADEGANMALGAATVWHGSPHKFDKFDSSKIGTGEGAQAYGHGLYLAESPDVAKQYADNVKPVTPWDLKNAKEFLLEIKSDKWGRYTKEDLARQEKIVSHYTNRLSDKSLYKVDLPDDAIAKMLDWDKPLSQQGAETKAALTPVIEQWFGKGNAPYVFNDPASPVKTGRDLMLSLGHDRSASTRLKDAGIPGIRYLDGGSRGTGAGTSNFVVFPGNEGLLSILERNGQPLK